MRGYSLLELLATLGLVTVMLGIGITQINKMNITAENGASELSSFLKQARAKAISSTLAYQISPAGSSRVITEYANNCESGTWTADPALSLNLPNGVSLLSTSWTLCINARGLPTTNETISLRDLDSQVKNVELLLGGAIRVY